MLYWRFVPFMFTPEIRYIGMNNDILAESNRSIQSSKMPRGCYLGNALEFVPVSGDLSLGGGATAEVRERAVLSDRTLHHLSRASDVESYRLQLVISVESGCLKASARLILARSGLRRYCTRLFSMYVARA